MAISPNSLTPIDASQGLINSFDKTNLDLENASVLGGPNKDLQTQYPATSTGTPTIQASPGAAKNYVPKFSPTFTYLGQTVGNPNNSISAQGPNTDSVTSLSPILQLASSLNKTSLDVEDSKIFGGPNRDYNTQYPKNVSGTPTTTQNPGGPAKQFTQKYTPQNPYENQINDKIVTNSALSDNPGDPTVLAITNLDVEKAGVIGGPNKDITTVYPYDVTGTPTVDRTPVGPPTNFSQKYTPVNTYTNQINNKVISNSPLSDNPKNPTVLSITSLDVANITNNSPAKGINDPTVYPALNTGTPTSETITPPVTLNITNAPKPFNQKDLPKNTYLEKFNILNRVLSGSLLSGDPLNPKILDITNLDNNKLIQYKSVNDPTLYPLESTGRSAIKAWPDTVQGAPSVSAQKFDPKYDSSKKYQENIEVDLGIAPKANEPEGPKPQKPGNAVVKVIKGVGSGIQAIGSLFGGASR